MWAASSVTETIIVAHDYGVSVAKELLARAHEGKLRTRLRGGVLLNGILYEELHRPLAIQRLLLNPLTGPLVTRLVRERDFARSFASVFSKAHPLDPADSKQHWQAVSRHAGTRIYDRIIRYITDGRRHAPRWRTTLRETTVPLWFVWGAEDPVTGMSMIEELRRERPDVRVTELTTVGHYPQLEVPDEIVRAIQGAHAALSSTV
jgi:pimeloyl-ACP methyl ester carboxylesterase